MGLKGLVSRLKRRTPEDPISHSGPKSGSNGKAILSPAPKETEIRPISQKLPTDERDLWVEARGKLPHKWQQELEKQGRLEGPNRRP